MTEFDSGKTERVSIAQTDLLVREVKMRKQTIYGTSRIPPYLYVHNNNLLHCNPFILNIWHVCVLLCVPVCLISEVYADCGYIAPLTLDKVSVGQWRSLFLLPQNSNAPTMRQNTPCFQTSMPMGPQMGANAFAI